MATTADTTTATNVPSAPAADAHDAARAASDAATGGAPTGTPAASADGVRATGGSAGTAAAGAVAGTMVGIQTGALAGAVTLGLGVVAGAALGAAAGAALGEDAQRGGWTADADSYYRDLYADGAAAGVSYDRVRPAYVFGHIAATEPGLAGMTWADAEPSLRAAWNDDLQRQAGLWDAVRGRVHDAFGHAQAEGAGVRRDRMHVGSAGSAVDPVELDRARHGLPSVGDPGGTPTA